MDAVHENIHLQTRGPFPPRAAMRPNVRWGDDCCAKYHCGEAPDITLEMMKRVQMKA